MSKKCLILQDRLLQRYVHGQFGNQMLFGPGPLHATVFICRTILALLYRGSVNGAAKNLIESDVVGALVSIVDKQREKMLRMFPSFALYSNIGAYSDAALEKIFEADQIKMERYVRKKLARLERLGLNQVSNRVCKDLSDCRSFESLSHYILFQRCVDRLEIELVAASEAVSPGSNLEHELKVELLRVICRLPMNIRETMKAQRRLLKLNTHKRSECLKVVGHGDLVRVGMVRDLVCRELDDMDLEVSFAIVPLDRPLENMDDIQFFGDSTSFVSRACHRAYIAEAFETLRPSAYEGYFSTPATLRLSGERSRPYESMVVARSSTHFLLMASRAAGRMQAELQIGRLLEVGRLLPLEMNEGVAKSDPDSGVEPASILLASNG